MADNNANGSQAGQGEQSQQSQADNQQSQSQADSSNQQNPNLTVEELKKIVEDLRKEQASNRNKLKAQETAQAKAEEERLKKQGEFQTLAEQREAELNEVKPKLEGLQGKYDELSKLAKTRLEAEVENWPDKLKAKLPKGDTVDALEMARAIDNYRDLAEEFGRQQAGNGFGRNGAGPNPAGVAQPDLDKAREEHGRLYASNY